MKNNNIKTISQLELVKRYFQKYMEYQEIYLKNEPSKEDIKTQFKGLIQKTDSTDLEFKQKAKSIWIDNIIRFNDLQFYRNKFLNAADNFLLTNKEDLPEDISKEFMHVKKSEYKPMFSIELGKFVENTKANLDNIPEQEFENIYNAIKFQIENS